MSYPQARQHSRGPQITKGAPAPRVRAGFSLMEMLIVIVVVGLLLLILVPRIGPTTARREVNGAAEAFASIFRQGRASAVQMRQTVTVSFNSGVATLLVSPGGVLDTIGYPLNFPIDFGLTPTVSGSTIVVGPTGMVTSGAPFTFTATKRGNSRTITVTGAGRIE
jgi:prepilin-type N-terminal cleavage/methylation domain-containing protein